MAPEGPERGGSWTSGDPLGVVFRAVFWLIIGSVALQVAGVAAVYMLLWFTGGSLC